MRKLKLKINDKDYNLELNRDSIKWLEANNFSIEEFTKKPITYYELLWASLFIKNHKDVNANLALKLSETYQEEKGINMYGKVVKFAVEEYGSFMSALADTDSTMSEELEITEN